MTLTIIGNISVDSIFIDNQLKCRNILGGSALNIAIGYKFSKSSPDIISIIGEDLPADKFQYLNYYFYDSSIKRKNGKTCKFEIYYYNNLNKSPKINADFGTACLLNTYALSQNYQSRNVHICCMEPLFFDLMIDSIIRQEANQISINVIRNSVLKLSRIIHLLDFVKYIFLNYEEFNILKQIIPISQIPSTILVTNGKYGSIAIKNGEMIHKQSATPVTRIFDPTGAGDVYAGSFLSSIEKGANLHEAMKSASNVSALSLSDFGALHLLAKV
jgi:sugar/nucleoside kinase (ribokinase family)